MESSENARRSLRADATTAAAVTTATDSADTMLPWHDVQSLGFHGMIFSGSCRILASFVGFGIQLGLQIVHEEIPSSAYVIMLAEEKVALVVVK